MTINEFLKKQNVFANRGIDTRPKLFRNVFLAWIGSIILMCMWSGPIAEAALTSAQVSARITELSGLQSGEIDQIHAAEQAASIVFVSADIPIPIVTEHRIGYLLIRNDSGQWVRIQIGLDEWLEDFLPYFDQVGVVVHERSQNVISTLAAAQDAAEIALESNTSGNTNANVILYGNPIGASGAPAAPPTPINHADPGVPVASDETGSVSGTFRVNEAGAATYSIPIFSAAGTAGVSPKMSLEYSSGSGNGIAGQGWSLGGLSAVSRCRQTYDQDRNPLPITWSVEDRFCLDGQRLVPHPATQTYGAANTTYRTEIDNGAVVTIRGNVNGEPDYFEVQRKDGTRSFYGKSPNAPGDVTAKDGAGAGKTMTWAIREMADNIGNPIWFKYSSDALGHRVTQIAWAYGGASGPSGYNARLVFNYTVRDDKKSGFVSGYEFRSDSRLDQILSYNSVGSESLNRSYKLRYNESLTTADKLSRLTSIEECVASTCLPKTTFEWRIPTNNISAVSSTTFSMGGNDLASFRPADINGDGRADLVWLEGSGDTKDLKFALSNGTGYVNTAFSSGNMMKSITVAATNPVWQTIDYNMDGRQDIAYFDTQALRWKVILSEPYGSGNWRLNSSALPTPLTSINAIFVDYDSNGTADALYSNGGSSVSWRPLELDPNEGNASARRYHFGAQATVDSTNLDIVAVARVAPDFDGDGRIDLVVQAQDSECGEPNVSCENFVRILASSGFNYTFPVFGRGASAKYPQMDTLQVLDVNADGLSDVFYGLSQAENRSNPNDILEYRLGISKGNGQFNYIPVNDLSLREDVANPQFVDWNMDGHPDLLWKDASLSGNVKARYWNPQSGAFDSAVIALTSPSTSTLEFVSYLDVNGDAAPDAVRINKDGTIGTVSIDVRKIGPVISNVATNRIEAINNGIGARSAIRYEPLAYSDHYERLQVDTSPGTTPVCEAEAVGGQQFCYDEPVQVATPGSFYQAINSGWDYPNAAHTFTKNSPVLELSGALYVVTEVTGDAPAYDGNPATSTTSNTSKIEYYYGEAKVQAAGRGLLGFERLYTVDKQSNIKTLTRYRQDWPFTGLPISTLTTTSAGHPLSASTSSWEIVEWTEQLDSTVATQGTAAAGSVHIVQTGSHEKTYGLVSNGAAAGNHLTTKTTESLYDSEGNVEWLKTTNASALDAADEVVVESTYLYDQANFDLWDARLSNTIVTTTRAGLAGGTTRESSFNYYTFGPFAGMLRTEITEPNRPELRFETEYGYDAHGNRVKSKLSGAGEVRCDAITDIYDVTGRYIDVTRDCLGRLTTEVVSRNQFGEPTQIETLLDANDSSSRTVQTIYYGRLGREYFRSSDDGSSSTTYLSSTQGSCPSGTAYRSINMTAGGGAGEVCFDKLARQTRALTRGFDGQWDAEDTLYDKNGRVRHKSEPFDLTSADQLAPHWTTIDYDLLGRPTNTTLADGSTGSNQYVDFAVTRTNDQLQKRIEHHNAQGEIVTAVDNLNGTTSFSYDHLGNLTKVIDNGNNVTETSYDDLGRKEWIDDPDKGYWSFQYNRFGQLAFETNANLQTSEMIYDGLGRMIKRYDRLANGQLEDETTWHYDIAVNGLGELASVHSTSTGYDRVFAFDSLGRTDVESISVDNRDFYTKTTFDQYGRPFQVFDAAGDGSFTDQGVVNHYNAFGYLKSVSDAALVDGVSRITYREIAALNARGQVVSELLGIDADGNIAASTNLTYDARTGRLTDVDSINADGLDVQDLHYQWDSLGNLEYRHENSGNKSLQESFEYDDLNRLKRHSVAGQAATDVTYDSQHLGNIKTKTGVNGTYSYGVNAGPHAVTSVGGSTYTYDDNGNNLSGGGRTISYFTFNKPNAITKGGRSTQFAYAPDRKRYRRADFDGGASTVTYYMGSVEIITRPNGVEEYKRYLAGVAIETIRRSGGVITERTTVFTLKDHLGSLDVIVDDEGNIVQELSFGPWGQRRNASSWQELSRMGSLIDLGPTFITTNTTRGFTGHEMVDGVGVIHMNGRIYDPFLGRFLQADPFVQETFNSQSLNRYSYVLNNPLNATDPSGHFFGFITAYLAAKVLDAVGLSELTPLVNLVGCIYGNLASCGGTVAGTTYATTGDFGQAVKQGALAAVSKAAFTEIGETDFGAYDAAVRPVVHGVTGGILAELQGGKFGHGFLSAGVSKAVNVNAIFTEDSQVILRIGTAAAVGGTISHLSGGKFANGAVTSAFAQAFNAEALGGRNRLKENRAPVRYRRAVEVSITAGASKRVAGSGASITVDGESISGTANVTVKSFDASVTTNGEDVTYSVGIHKAGVIVSASVSDNGDFSGRLGRAVGNDVASASAVVHANSDGDIGSELSVSVAQADATIDATVNPANVAHNTMVAGTSLLQHLVDWFNSHLFAMANP